MLLLRIAVFLLVAAMAPASPTTQEPSPEPARGAWPQEPTSYRGIGWGTPFEEAKKPLKTGLCWCRAPGGGGEDVDCKKRVAGMPAPWRTCVTQGFMVGSVPIRDSVTFDDAGLAHASMAFDTSDYAAIRETFLSKYGAPHTAEQSRVSNMIGATFDQEALVWTGPNATVMLMRYGSKVTEGLATISLVSYNEKRAEKERAKREAAKDAF